MKRSLKLSVLEKEVGRHVHGLDKVKYQGREWTIVFMSEDRDLILLED